MRRRLVAAVVLLVVVAGVVAVAGGKPSRQQAFFENALLDDERTSASIKSALRGDRAIVDRRSGFVDVTGDGRTDAIVLVTTGGAAGTIALYVFSTHGEAADDAPLRAKLRLQALHRATLRISGQTITVVEPRWAPGDELCCPRRMRERDYGWDGETFRRTALRDVDAA